MMYHYSLKYIPVAVFTLLFLSGYAGATNVISRNASGNLTMLDRQGLISTGANNLQFDWDWSVNNDEINYVNNRNFNMTITTTSLPLLFGATWSLHHIRVFGPGIYSFDSGCTLDEIELHGCPADSAAISGEAITMTVRPGRFGAHMLFDWNTEVNTDVVNVWDVNALWEDPDGGLTPLNDLWTGEPGSNPFHESVWGLVSRDFDGDGINGAAMVDGTFMGFSMNLNTPGPETDSDGDGIDDDVDNCPVWHNPSQTDSDGNGEGDPCDSDVNPGVEASDTQLASMSFWIWFAIPLMFVARRCMQSVS